jgi:hypothetical protein
MADDWLFKTAHVKLAGWMAPFGDMFTAPTWQRVLVLLIGAVLSPGRRTVARPFGSLAWTKIHISPTTTVS